jgi:hypothetical protein
MVDGKKKARRTPLAVIMILLLLGLIVGGWLTVDEWLESGEALPAAIIGTASAVAFAVMTAAGSSGRACGDCWLKNLYQRVKHRQTSRG